MNPLFLFFSVHSLSLSMLATKLNLSADDAERWIVNLIRNAKLDAKIDAKEVSIVVHKLVYLMYMNKFMNNCGQWSPS